MNHLPRRMLLLLLFNWYPPNVFFLQSVCHLGLGPWNCFSLNYLNYIVGGSFLIILSTMLYRRERERALHHPTTPFNRLLVVPDASTTT